MILAKIVAEKKKEIEEKKREFPLENFISALTPSQHSFKKAISQKGLNLIAEIKKSSPSTGEISQFFSLKNIISIYNQNQHVKAISVLTDKKFFGMSPKSLQKARALTSKPILRKEFIIDPYQIYESRFLGADAILLIASLLSEQELNAFITIAKKYGMGCLVEAHTENELKNALQTKAEIIGINNRNLDTLKTDTGTALKLAPLVPKDKSIVAESGYETKEDIRRIRGKVNAVLMGTTLLKAKDIDKQIEEIFWFKRKIVL